MLRMAPDIVQDTVPQAIPVIEDAISLSKYGGYAVIDLDAYDDSTLAQAVLCVARRLGEPYGGRRGMYSEVLRPLSEAEARPRSLSWHYGLSQLPWHTDTAHRETPARWLVMACVDPGSVEVTTSLLRWRDLDLSPELHDAARTCPFVFRNGRQSFLSTIEQTGRPFVRYDPGCMQALDACGTRLQSELAYRFSSSGAAARVDWLPGRLLVLNNWEFLHCRADAHRSKDRTLIRAYAA
jgi:hypothetical protein